MSGGSGVKKWARWGSGYWNRREGGESLVTAHDEWETWELTREGWEGDTTVREGSRT